MVAAKSQTKLPKKENAAKKSQTKIPGARQTAFRNAKFDIFRISKCQLVTLVQTKL